MKATTIMRRSLYLCFALTISFTETVQAQCSWSSATNDLPPEEYAGSPINATCSSDQESAYLSSAARGLAEYDLNTNELKSMGTLNSRVRKTMDLGTEVVAVGAFSSITDSEGTKAIKGIAVFNKAARTWSGLGGGIEDGEAKAVASIGSRLIVGGSFTALRQTDGTLLSVRGLAQFNRTTGEWERWGNGLADGDVRAIEVVGEKIFVAGKFNEAIKADKTPLASKNMVSYPTSIACRVDCTVEVSAVGFDGVGGGEAAETSVQALKYDALSGKLAVGGKFSQIRAGARSILAAASVAELDVAANTFSASAEGARGTVTSFSKEGNSKAVSSKLLFTQADAHNEDWKGSREAEKRSNDFSYLLAVDGKVARVDLASGAISARAEAGATGGDVLGLTTCGDKELMVGSFTAFNSEPTADGVGFCSAVALAVEMVSFSVDAVESGASLSWTTGSETNNSGFEIERAVNGGSFSNIGFVAGQGASSVEVDYSFLDEINTSTLNRLSYRLKQIDYDGEVSYSEIVELDLETPTEITLDQNFPNPFNPSTSISFSVPSTQNVTLEVFNSMGQKVATLLNGAVDAGHHSVSFSAENLPSGVYAYSLSSDGISQLKTMTLQK